MAWKHWHPTALAVSLARGSVVGLALGITIVLSVLSSIWLSLFDATAMDVFASQMSFTPDRFVDVVGPWGPAGISEFIRVTATLDFVYPVAYAVAIGALWARLAGPQAWGGPAWPLAAVFIAAAADWVENLLHAAGASAMVGGDRPSALLVAAGSVFATVKWVLLVASLMATAAAASRRPGRARLASIPIALLAGGFAAAVLAATI